MKCSVLILQKISNIQPSKAQKIPKKLKYQATSTYLHLKQVVVVAIVGGGDGDDDAVLDTGCSGSVCGGVAAAVTSGGCL